MTVLAKPSLWHPEACHSKPGLASFHSKDEFQSPDLPLVEHNTVRESEEKEGSRTSSAGQSTISET